MPPRRPPPTPHDRAIQCVRMLVDSLYQSARSVETRTRLTNAQLAVLRLVSARGPLSVNDIAARMHAGQSSVSTVLARLTRARLVARARAVDDGRRVIIRLSPAGARKLRKSPRPPSEYLLSAVEQLSEAQARHLADLLGVVLRGMNVPRKAPLLFD